MIMNICKVCRLEREDEALIHNVNDKIDFYICFVCENFIMNKIIELLNDPASSLSDKK